MKPLGMAAFLQACRDSEYFASIYLDPENASGAFEDDGSLHVVRAGLRYVFNVGHDDPTIQTERTRKVMADLNLEVTDRVLVKPAAPDDKRCPHCGREM